MKRILNPATNPAGWSAALALAYALAQAVVNVHAQHKALSAPVVVAIAGGVLSWWIRNRVTPVADPKDGAGNPLKTVSQLPLDVQLMGHRFGDVPDVPDSDVAAAYAEAVAARDALRRQIAQPPPSDPLRNTGYTGGKPASEMPPPPADVPSVALLPPAVQPPATGTGGTQ